MKTGLSVAAVLVALAVSAPAFAQTGDSALLQSKLAQCRTIVDPGLKAQCMEQARSMMRSQQTQQQQMQQQMPGQYRPGINSNLPPQNQRNR